MNKKGLKKRKKCKKNLEEKKKNGEGVHGELGFFRRINTL